MTDQPLIPDATIPHPDAPARLADARTALAVVLWCHARICSRIPDEREHGSFEAAMRRGSLGGAWRAIRRCQDGLADDEAALRRIRVIAPGSHEHAMLRTMRDVKLRGLRASRRRYREALAARLARSRSPRVRPNAVPTARRIVRARPRSPRSARVVRTASSSTGASSASPGDSPPPPSPAPTAPSTRTRDEGARRLLLRLGAWGGVA